MLLLCYCVAVAIAVAMVCLCLPRTALPRNMVCVTLSLSIMAYRGTPFLSSGRRLFSMVRGLSYGPRLFLLFVLRWTFIVFDLSPASVRWTYSVVDLIVGSQRPRTRRQRPASAGLVGMVCSVGPSRGHAF